MPSNLEYDYLLLRFYAQRKMNKMNFQKRSVFILSFCPALFTTMGLKLKALVVLIRIATLVQARPEMGAGLPEVNMRQADLGPDMVSLI